MEEEQSYSPYQQEASEEMEYKPGGQVVWTIIILLIILVGGGSGFYIAFSNRKFKTELDALTPRNVQGVFESLADRNLIKLQEEGEEGAPEISYEPLENVFVPYTFGYPNDWNVSFQHRDNPDTQKTTIYGYFEEKPFLRLDGAITRIADIQLTNKVLTEEEDEASILQTETQGLVSVTTEKITNEQGVKLIKVTGQWDPEFIQGPPPYPSTYFYLAFFTEGDKQYIKLETIPVETRAGLSLPDAFMVILDHMAETFAYRLEE